MVGHYLQFWTGEEKKDTASQGEGRRCCGRVKKRNMTWGKTLKGDWVSRGGVWESRRYLGRGGDKSTIAIVERDVGTISGV